MHRLLILFAVFSLMACFGTRKKSDAEIEKINDVMITFIKNAQAGFWKEAMESVSLEERAEMMEGVNVMQEYKDAIRRVRLSTIKNMDLSLDRKGRLVGLKDVLDESNERYIASDQKVFIDPSKLEDRAALRKKREEEEAKKAMLEPVKEEKNAWLDVYYGNTKSGGGGLKDMKKGGYEETEEEDD